MNTSDQALTHIHALVYGDSGIGKTTSLRTLPEDKTLICISERGSLPLRHHKYPVFPMESWEDVQAIYAILANIEGVEDAAIETVVAKTKIVAIDSLSDIAQLCMSHILTVDRKVLQAERTGGKSDKPASVYEDLMTMEDWNLLRIRLRSLLAAFTRLPYHIIFTALAAWSQDKTGGVVQRTPNLSGKLAFEVASFFDIVIHMEARETAEGADSQRVFRTFNDNRSIAKDASGALDLYEPSDWTGVFKKILGDKKTNTGKATK
jgi:hypothetical protein